MSRLDKHDRDSLESSQFAFPKQRKEPLENASHVRNAVARFDQVEGVSDAERDEAWRRIKMAARRFDVRASQGSVTLELWSALGRAPTSLRSDGFLQLPY